jgi:hypothetical protein
VTGSCALCDAPAEADEPLCASCFASPEERAVYDRASSVLASRERAAAYFRAAKNALAMARRYAAQAGAADPRVEHCLDEVRRCRVAVRELRAEGGIVATALGERPGLRKASVPPPAGVASRPRAAR